MEENEKKTETLSASEALYAFCGELTSKKEKTVMSSTDDASKIAEAVDEFCKRQKLDPPRDNWTDYKK